MKKKEIDPTYYENHDFGEELYEAERTGNLIVPQPGETTLDAIKRYMEAKIKPTASVRLPVGVLNEVKGRVAVVGVSKKKKREIDPVYYENHDFGEEFYEAEKNGDLIYKRAGETPMDVIKR
jgi:hypothetical protein